MRTRLATVLLVASLMLPGAAFARARSHASTKPPSSDPKTYKGYRNKDKPVRVDSYQRKDGKWVRGHYRRDYDTAPHKKDPKH